MKRNRRYIRYCMILAAMLLLAGCSTEPGEEVREDDDRGYNLPVDGTEREEAEQDCAAVLELTKEFWQDAQDEGGVLTAEEAEAMAGVIAEQGDPVTTFDLYQNMKNYEVMDDFLEGCEGGQSGEAAEYEVYKDGSIGRKKFICDGEDLYVLSVTCSWRGEKQSIGEMTYTRAERWNYTDRGWFFYKLCTPGYPEVTEVLYSNAMLRVKPYEEECAEISRTCLEPIAYEGNNLL